MYQNYITLASYNSDTKEIEWFKNFKKDIPKVTKQAESFFDLLGSDPNVSWINAEEFVEYASSLNIADEKFQEWLKTIKSSGTVYKTSKEALAGYQSYLKSIGQAAQFADLKTKAFAATAKVLSTIGWMALFAAVGKVIGLGIDAINNWINRVDVAKEKLEESQSALKATISELESINSQLKDNNKRINEINAKGSLTYVEKGELEKLQDTNEELRFQIALLKKQNDLKSAEVIDNTLDVYHKEFSGNSVSDESIAKKKTFIDETFSADIEYEPASSNSDLSLMIAQYQKFREVKEEALESGDDFIYQKFSGFTKDAENTLWEHIETLQSYKKELSSIPYDKLSVEAQLDLIDISNSIEYIWKLLDPNQWNNIQIDSLFQVSGIEKTKDEFIAMAKASELTPESIRRYPNFNIALSESGIFLNNGQTAAEAFCDEINACAKATDAASDSLNNLNSFEANSITETISSLNEMAKSWSTVDNLYAEFVDKDFKNFSNEALYNFAEAFKKMGGIDTESFLSLLSNSSSTADEVQAAFNRLATEYIYTSNCLEDLTDANANHVIKELEAHGIINASSIIYKYLAEAKEYAELTGKDLVDASTEEIVAFLNEKGAAEDAEISISSYALQKEISNGVTLKTDDDIINIKALIQACGGGITALNAYHRAKQGIVDFFSQSPLGKADLKNLSPTDLAGGLQLKQDKWIRENADTIKSQKDNLNQLFIEVEDEIKNAIHTVDYEGGGAVKKSQKENVRSKNKKEETPQKFDWIKIRNEYLEREHKKFQKIVDDETKSYEDQLDAIDNLIDKDKKRLEFANRVLAEYQKKWEAIIAKLSNEDIDRVMEGNITIEEHSGQYAKDLQEAIDIHEGIVTYEEEIANLNQETKNHIREQLKIREEIIKAQQDEIKAQMDLQQSRIDLIEAQGGVVTERMLKNQIQLSENLIDSYNDKIDNLYDQISEVAPDSADYYSLMAEIDACERAIINCKIQQEEWNERIMRLPIERIQKYLNMLAGIKQDLQNFLDEQSAMGIQPSADQLQQLFDISREEIKSLLEQQEKLKDLLEQYKFGSEKFNDVSQELQDIDNTISGLIQSQKEWNASILQIPIDQMSKLNDTLNLVGSTLDNLLSDYDSALSAVTGVIDKQTESLEELKSAADESYQDKIAPLREELNLLQKQNEERQTEIDLEQKQYHLDKARSQKTNQVVRNGEIIYEADADAIRTANQELSDAEYNKLVKDLGNQISELEEERDKLLESYDTQIEKLNEIKEKWSSIVDEIKLASDISKADKVLGQGWQDKILNGNDDGIYELFKGLYENTTSQKSQLEEQTASNERIAEMMNQFVTRYQEGSLSYEQAMAGIRELSEQMKDGYSSLEQLDALLNLHGVDNLESLLQNMQTGANTSTDQLSKYMELVKANADAMNQYASSWEDMQKNISDQIAALEKLAEEAAKAVDIMKKHDSNNRIESVIGSGGPNVNNNHYVSSGPGHTAEALADAIAGGKEILEYHTGGLVGAKEAPSRYIGLLSSKNLSDNEVYGKLLKHEWVLTEEQQKIFDSNIKSLLNANHTPRINVSSGFPNVTSAKPTITINMGDTILEHVTKPDEFAHALAAQFKPLLRQEMSKL